MKFKRILLFVIVMIFMTGTLATEAATTPSAAALAPWTTGIIDQAAGKYLGQHVSIAHYEHNGRAYVSYYDASGGNLKLAYEVDAGTGNCPGNANWQCETVDTGFIFMLTNDDVGQYSSIDVIDETIYLPTGNQDEINAQPPHSHRAKIGISYYNATAKSLKFAIGHCSVSAGCSWDKTEVDDDPNDTIFSESIGTYSSFNFGTEAVPIIYYHTSVLSLGKVKRAYVTTNVNGACDAGWYCDVIAASNVSSGYGTHISADNGRVAFYNPTNGSLVVAHSTGVDTNTCLIGGGINRWDCEVVDNVGDVGKFASLYYDGVHPMQVAYYDADTPGKVKFAIQTTAGAGKCMGAGSNFDCLAVDTVGIAATNSHVGIALDLDAEGQPIIAYQEFSDLQAPAALKLARPAHVYDVHGNCGGSYPSPVPPLFPYWRCDFLDGGGEVEEADYVAISVSKAGLATVAYYEIDNYNYAGRLKVAQQHFMTYLPLILK